MAAVSTETYREKALRKFKQQPLVPVGATLTDLQITFEVMHGWHGWLKPFTFSSLTGAAATTVALVIAMTKMRKGHSRSFNNWLRLRILAQGLTVAAVVAGSWAYGSARPMTPELDASAAREKAAEERVAFEDRLRLAEEVTRAESASASSSSPTTNVRPTAVTRTKEPTSTPTTSSSWRSWWGWNESRRGKDKTQ
jgi:hypothetical protein